VIYNLNHNSICIEISLSATSFNLTHNDLSKIDLQVGIINNLMPYWSGDMKLCPTRNIMSPSGFALGGHDMVGQSFISPSHHWPSGHQMYSVDCVADSSDRQIFKMNSFVFSEVIKTDRFMFMF
jgi:hypothetical protein